MEQSCYEGAETEADDQRTFQQGNYPKLSTFPPSKLSFKL